VGYWNATQAAIRAGYSKKTAKQQGSRLLTKVDLGPSLEKAAKLAELTAEEVVDGIRRTVACCEEPGQDFQPFAVLKGYELLGKRLKLFTEKVEITGDEALFERLTAGRKRLQS
jgi:phage terminase small subunit